MTEKKKSKAPRHLPLMGLVPNMITILALCAGLSSIRFALNERWEVAVSLIILAGVMDGMDGRLARLLNATSKLGAELDSLADFMNFGVAPALLLYLWLDMGAALHGFGWTLVLLFASCMALRLARFNTHLDDEDIPEWKDNFFTGVPAPVGGSLLMLPIILTFLAKDKLNMDSLPIPFFVIGIYFAVISLLVISRVPTISIKKMTVHREFVPVLLIIVMLLIGLLVVEPWILLTLIAAVYLISIPFTAISYLNMCKKYGE